MLIAGDRVFWFFKSGNDRCKAVGVIQSMKGDRAVVTVSATGKTVSVPVSHLVAESQDKAVFGKTAAPEILDRFRMGMPTESQMRSINSFLPNGAEPLQAEKLVTIPFVVADNLVNRGLECWDIPSLDLMPKLLPGLPKMLDHDWDETAKEWGRIYSASVVRSTDAPTGLIERADNGKENRKIVNEFGLVQVVAEVFAQADSPVVKALQHGHSGNVSLGAFRVRDLFCPLCKTSFWDDNCPHVPPFPAWGIYPSDDEEKIAPYAIRVGLFDLGESSIVSIPNCAGASVV